MVGNYMRRSGSNLYCLGTWHSHVYATGPSALDRATAAIVARGRIAPSVLLVSTPRGYRAVLAEDDGEPNE
jgi:hypothetical protein